MSYLPTHYIFTYTPRPVVKCTLNFSNMNGCCGARILYDVLFYVDKKFATEDKDSFLLKNLAYSNTLNFMYLFVKKFVSGQFGTNVATSTNERIIRDYTPDLINFIDRLQLLFTGNYNITSKFLKIDVNNKEYPIEYFNPEDLRYSMLVLTDKLSDSASGPRLLYEIGSNLKSGKDLWSQPTLASVNPNTGSYITSYSLFCKGKNKTLTEQDTPIKENMISYLKNKAA